VKGWLDSAVVADIAVDLDEREWLEVWSVEKGFAEGSGQKWRGIGARDSESDPADYLILRTYDFGFFFVSY